jgi:hypothetical protein
MYKYLLVLIAALALNAEEGKKPKTGGPDPVPPQLKGERPPRPKLTEEQKKQRDELIKKYDVNKDGKLDKEERAKVSDDDRKLLRSFGPPPGGPKGPKHDGPSKDGDRPTKPKKN